MTRYNFLTAEIYTGANRLPQVEWWLDNRNALAFSKCTPGGKYLDCGFFIPRQVNQAWPVRIGQRLLIRNKLTPIWEGKIINLQDVFGADMQGTLVRAIGYWGELLDRWAIRKWWCVSSFDEFYWRYQTDVATYTGAEKCSIDRQSRIRFTPKGVAWASGEFAAVRITHPGSETWKKIEYDYNLTEAGAEAWEIAIRNVGTSTDVVTITSGSATSQSHTFATPTSAVELRFYSRAAQTPVENGSTFGQFSNIKIYSETSAINMEEIAKDLVGLITDLNSSTAEIDAAGTPLTISPFVADHLTGAEILADVTGRGDGAYNRWRAFLECSEKAASPDGKPLLALQQYPSTTDYNVAVSLHDPNLVRPYIVSQDLDTVVNDLIVSYTDESGYVQYRTSADNAALADSTSIAAYGKRQPRDPVHLGDSTSTIADAYARRFLATYKDPQFHLVQPIVVRGYIRGRYASQRIPASEIEPGMVVRLDDYDRNLVITTVAYNDERESATINVGLPSAPIAPFMQHLRPMPVDAPIPTGGGDSSGGGDGGGDTGGGSQLEYGIGQLLGLSAAEVKALKRSGKWKAIKARALARKRRTGKFKGRGWKKEIFG